MSRASQKARNRDYKAEYERRIAKGLAEGKTKQAARGQAKAEPTRRAREKAQKAAGERTETSAEKYRRSQKAKVAAKRSLTDYQKRKLRLYIREQEIRTPAHLRDPDLYRKLVDWVLSHVDGWNRFKTLIRGWRDEVHADYQDEVAAGTWDWPSRKGERGPWAQFMEDHMAFYNIPDQKLLWYH